MLPNALFWVLLALLSLSLLGLVVWALQLKARAEMAAERARRVETDHQTSLTQLAQLQKDLEADREELHDLASQRASLEERTAQLSQRAEKAETRQKELEGELEAARAQTAKLDKLLGQKETDLDKTRQYADEQLENLRKEREQLKEQFKQQFENLSNRIFDEKTEKFSKSSQEGLSKLLSPLKEQLEGFKKKVEDTHEKRTEDQAKLLEQIRNLQSLNQTLAHEAHALTNALKGESKTQGDWGELILERVLEQSGLSKGREFDLQPSFANAEGGQSRPDAIIHLPEGRDLVVDAKVSLTAYERYHSAEDDAERARALKEHLASVKAHVKGLAGKDYQNLPGLKTLDFVLMFIPLEAAFLAAHDQDSTLFKLAFDSGVLLASPSTLLVTLRTVANLWRYEDQNQNAFRIAEQAGKLLDKFVLFSEALDEVGKRIDQAQVAYDQAKGRFSEGRGNLLSHAHKLKELGVSAQKALPELPSHEDEADQAP